MSGDGSCRDGELAAGDFGSWIRGIERAIREGAGSDVPCDGCTACCRSYQFVHVGPDELDTLAVLPEDLLFPAPGRPDGHRVLPHDAKGHCPMLVDDRCSIYEHRPRACRTYDCRIFAATGVDPGERQEAVGARARRWQFTFASGEDRDERDACRNAAAFLDTHPGVWPRTPPDPGGMATAAVAVHDLFVTENRRGGNQKAHPSAREVGAELSRRSGSPGGAS